MSTALEKGREAFKIEAAELLEDMESALLALEETPEDEELISRVFRAMHTIKGSGGMFGFENIESFTHDIETVFDSVRNGEVNVTKKLIDLTLAACDHIQNLLEASTEEESPVDNRKAKDILEAFQQIASIPKSQTTPAVEVQNEAAKRAGSESRDTLFHIVFKPNQEIFRMGTNPILLLDELCELGESRVIACTEAIPPLEKMDPELCYTSWDILLKTSQDQNTIKDVFIFVEDECELKIKVLYDDLDGSVDIEWLASQIREKKSLKKKEIEKAIKKVPVSVKEPNPGQVENKPDGASPDTLKPKKNETQKKTGVVSSIRVQAEKLDKLVNLVGELVIAQARLSQLASHKLDADLTLLSEEQERLVNELRETTMETRMIPIGTLFSKFKRLVRDLAHEQGKKIDLIVEGSETELDKTVIEKLNDPLVHIVRNSIDHGIEPEAIRMVTGKANRGEIRLSAFHSGADVVIQIQDDGTGLDAEAIQSKAIEKGLISTEAGLTDKEILKLIFMAGFSTKEKVTNLSGRGVGMDVVKRNIEALRGAIDIDSKKGKGTTITLKLPLTLGIIDGLLVRIAEDNYVFPLAAVEECVELNNGNGKSRRRLLDIRGHAVPYIRLREQFQMASHPPDIEEVLITRSNGQQVGFAVDRVIGEQQIVIKALGKMYKDVKGLSGATILGDGTVALILDIPKLIELAQIEERMLA